MEAEVILDGVRAEEDDSLGCHHQDEAVQGLQRENMFVCDYSCVYTVCWVTVRVP